MSESDENTKLTANDSVNRFFKDMHLSANDYEKAALDLDEKAHEARQAVKDTELSAKAAAAVSAVRAAYTDVISAYTASVEAELFPLRNLVGDLVELHVHFLGGHFTVVGRVGAYGAEYLWVGPCHLKITALVRRDSVGPGFVFDCKEQDV